MVNENNWDFGDWFLQNWKKLVFLTILIFTVYFNSLGNDFVADDVPGILQNKEIGNFSSVISRPLGFVQPLLYFIAFRLGGLNPFFFRLFSLLFHLGNIWLAYILVSRLLNSKVALFAASLFAVHPILTESVTWISGGVHAQYSFFLLFSLFFYERFLSQGKRKFLVFSILGFLLALISSEKAIILPFLFLLFLISFKDWRKLWLTLIPFWLIGLAFGLLYVGGIGQRLESLQTQFYQQPQILNPLVQIPIAITSYLELIIFPKNLTLYHSEMFFSQGEYLIRLAILLLFLGLTVWLFFKNRPLSFWPGLFIIGLLPTLTPLGISWVVAERYVYFSSLGIFVLIALVFEKISQTKLGKKTIPVIFGIILILLSVKTIVRNNDWQNQDSLWLAAAKTSPSSSQNHNNLGDYYGRHGEYEKAIEEFKRAIELNPKYADAFHNLGNTYQQVGKTDLAIENYEKAIEFNPQLWQSYQSLAVIYFAKQDFELAAQNMEKAAKASPDNATLYFNLGVIYQKLGKNEEANQAFEKALELNPNLKQ